MISGILHRYREGVRWRAVPAEYGPRTTLFNHFDRWSEKGIWQELFAALVACQDPPEFALLDSSAVRAHRSAAGAKEGQQHQAVGRSRGGATTKIHALADVAGRLYALMLTARQVHDIHGGRARSASVPTVRKLIADKAYDANDFCDFLIGQDTEPVVSPNPRRLVTPAVDRVAYRARNLIERALSHLKDRRGIATRYDKTARNFLAGICLAVLVTDWLR